MEKKKPSLGQYFNLPNPGLWAYFKHVEDGQQDDYRTPFWNKAPRESILEKWNTIMDAKRADMKMPGLAEFESEMLEKVGPLSVQQPLAQRIESIEHYYTLANNTKSVPIDPRAIEETWKTFSKAGGIRERTYLNAAAHMRLSTNSGTPYFTKRRLVLDKTLKSRAMSPLTPDKLYNYDMAAVLGWRGQEGGPSDDDVKQRVVWMAPLSLNILESTIYQPLIESWQKNSINSAYISMRAVEEKITRLFDTKGDEYVVVTDFSKFDQHFNRDLQNASKELIKRMLTFNPYTDAWLENVFPYKFSIPLICSEGLMYTGLHGMASGSTGTNFDECCAHSAMQQEVAILNGKRLNPYSNAYGDDGYLSFEGIDVDKVISAYTSHGQEMNPSKQSVDKHSAVYLRRYFHDSYRDSKGIMLGVYSTNRALGRLMGQERFFDPEKWSAKMVVLRALSIIENCANHPLFEEFVDFCITGDEYQLGLKIPGFLDSIKREAKDAIELIPDFLGYTKMLQGANLSGIDNWRVVQYLKSKRR